MALFMQIDLLCRNRVVSENPSAEHENQVLQQAVSRPERPAAREAGLGTGGQEDRGAILLWVAMGAGKAADPRGKAEKAWRRRLSPSATQKEKLPATVALDFTHDVLKQTQVSLFLLYSGCLYYVKMFCFVFF